MGEGAFVFLWGGGLNVTIYVYIETPAVHIDCNMIYVK